MYYISPLDTFIWISIGLLHAMNTIHTKNMKQILHFLMGNKITIHMCISINYMFCNAVQYTVGFWCQTIHKKFLRRFDTIFGLKMMMKRGLEKIILKFHDGLQSCCCPVQKIIILSQKWCQISVRIFCVHIA